MSSHLRLVSLFVLTASLLTSANTAHQHSHAEETDARVVLNHVPRDPNGFQADVAPLVNSIIARHGQREWEIVVLTNEFHRHLGIYSILGAKMGLAARDYFQVGLDELKILSYAGQRPPISCLNDGLQVSTGATLGHGTISIADVNAPRPSAQFTHDDQVITLTLKQTYWDQIRTDIHNAIKIHGFDTPGYWEAVRQCGLNYWLQWSRQDLFDKTVSGL